MSDCWSSKHPLESERSYQVTGQCVRCVLHLERLGVKSDVRAGRLDSVVWCCWRRETGNIAAVTEDRVLSNAPSTVHGECQVGLARLSQHHVV